MKARNRARDSLYDMMDELIIYNKNGCRGLLWITLSSEQIQLFKEFNDPENNAYYYKKNLIKGL